MTTIREALKPFILLNPARQAEANAQLKTTFLALAKDHQGWKYFQHLIETGNTGFPDNTMHSQLYHPDNVISLCDKLGLVEYKDLMIWLEGNKLVSSAGLIDTHSPTIDLPQLDDSYKIRFSQVKKLVVDNCKLKYTHEWGKQFDPILYTIPAEAFDYIRRQCPIDRLKYIANKRDCDKFAFMTRSWLSLCGYGNLALCYVSVSCTEINEGRYKHRFNHGINLAVLQDSEGAWSLKYWEPQNDKTWGVGEPMPFGVKEYSIEQYYTQP